jgi:hypothetical protein
LTRANNRRELNQSGEFHKLPKPVRGPDRLCCPQPVLLKRLKSIDRLVGAIGKAPQVAYDDGLIPDPRDLHQGFQSWFDLIQHRGLKEACDAAAIDRFELSVANGGEPISPEALQRLFQPFFRGSVRRVSRGWVSASTSPPRSRRPTGERSGSHPTKQRRISPILCHVAGRMVWSSSERVDQG